MTNASGWPIFWETKKKKFRKNKTTCGCVYHVLLEHGHYYLGKPKKTPNPSSYFFSVVSILSFHTLPIG